MNVSHFSLSEISDKQLLTLLQQGEQKAFIAIYERHHKLLYILAYRYLKNRDLAKDAIQQIFLKLWETHRALTINISLRNYLYTMLKNYALNEIRNHTAALEKHYQILQESVEYEEELLSKLEEHEMLDQLYTAIERLPEQKRLICLYKIQENLSNQEIAEKMQISIPTVKTHYTQAIKMLRQHFDKILIVVFIIFNNTTTSMSFGLGETTLTKIISVFQQYEELEEVIIYNSRAIDNFREGSNIDITLKGEK